MTEMNKKEFIECENKLLHLQQGNYKDLCKVLSERHMEMLKYIDHLKMFIQEKILTESKNETINGYVSDKWIYESNIAKYDKQIQMLTETIHTSQSQISDNAGTLLKEQLKILSTSLDSNSSTAISNYSKYRCDFFECQEEFSSKHLLESHSRSHHNGHYGTSMEHYESYSKKDIHDAKMNDVLFVPQMELQVLEFGNPYQLGEGLNHNMNHLDPTKSNIFKKLSPCEFCGKYFNRHYLESHKRRHTGTKPYTCRIDGCIRQFTQTSSRNFHERRYHRESNVGKYMFKCSYLNCEMSFDRLEEMQKHLQQHQALINTVAHTMEIGTIKREHQNSNLQIDIGKTKHRSGRTESGGHKHVCVHCGKAFAYKIGLRQHSLLHGEKNFQCPKLNCSYSSYWKHNLGLHMKKHHTAESQ